MGNLRVMVHNTRSPDPFVRDLTVELLNDLELPRLLYASVEWMSSGCPETASVSYAPCAGGAWVHAFTLSIEDDTLHVATTWYATGYGWTRRVVRLPLAAPDGRLRRWLQKHVGHVARYAHGSYEGVLPGRRGARLREDTKWKF